MDYLKILQQNMAKLQGGQQTQPARTKADWGRMLSAFGAGMAGTEGGFMDALAGGARGAAGHIQHLDAKKDKQKDRDARRLQQLQDMHFRAQMGDERERKRRAYEERVTKAGAQAKNERSDFEFARDQQAKTNRTKEQRIYDAADNIVKNSFGQITYEEALAQARAAINGGGRPNGSRRVGGLTNAR